MENIKKDVCLEKHVYCVMNKMRMLAMKIKGLTLCCLISYLLCDATSFAAKDSKSDQSKKYHLYGNEKGHKLFLSQSEDAINWAQKSISMYVKRALNGKKALHSYFSEFLGDETTGLAKFRHEIAVKTNSRSKDSFGRLRAKDTKFLLEFSPVRGQWHNEMNVFMRTKLSTLDAQQDHNIVYIKSNRSYQSLYLVHQKNCLDESNLEHARDILINHYKYDPKYLNDERLVRLARHESESLDILFFNVPNAKAKRFIRMEQRHEDGLKVIRLDMHLVIKDARVPTSTVYGVFKPDASRKNGVSPVSLDMLSQKSFYIVSHTPREYINMLTEVCAEYWEKAILRDKKDVAGIKEDLANIMYIQTHAMPYLRGSEAIVKWVVESVARYHGFTIQYPKDFVFQKPFYTTIDDFVDEFKSEIQFITLQTSKSETKKVFSKKEKRAKIKKAAATQV